MHEVDIAIVVITALILISDLGLYLTDRPTYSQRTIKWAKILMLVPFAWGFLMGHWFG